MTANYALLGGSIKIDPTDFDASYPCPAPGVQLWKSAGATRCDGRSTRRRVASWPLDLADRLVGLLAELDHRDELDTSVLAAPYQLKGGQPCC